MNGLSGALSPTVSGHDGALFLSIWGTWTIINTPVDALPDLSDVQVIIKTSYPGQAPQIVENRSPIHLPPPCCPYRRKTVRGFHSSGIRMCMSF
nr:Cation efflux system protein CusA [Klebsiella pneumoniae]